MVTHLFMKTRNLKQIFKWPVVIGVLTALGLVTALLEDGVIEGFSNAALAIPIIVILYIYYRH